MNLVKERPPREMWFVAFAIVSGLLLTSMLTAQTAENPIPKKQQPIARIFAPKKTDQTESATGKFVIFTRDLVGNAWSNATAWECIPSKPELPITKRLEFSHSSGDCDPLLDTLVRDDSEGLHPRFVVLRIDGERPGEYTENLYDIDYLTWEVRSILKGRSVDAFGVLSDSIFCHNHVDSFTHDAIPDDWFVINAASGNLRKEVPFIPIATDGNFWLVKKPGQTEGCWSYDRRARQYVGQFGRVNTANAHFARSTLSSDGMNRAWVIASAPAGWQGGSIAGRLILQRSGEKKDVLIPIEMLAQAGSGVPVIPVGLKLDFLSDGTLEFRSQKDDTEAKDRVWRIAIATGKVESRIEPHLPPARDDTVIDGVRVPEYLRDDISKFRHFGRGGLAAAFLLDSGILKNPPAYPDCAVGVSRDGRHALYRARNGPLAGVYIYADLITKQTLQWRAPEAIHVRAPQEFVWVETP